MKAWYVVQTRAGLERAVSRAIKTDDIDVFLPTFKRDFYVGGRKEEIIRPLFPLYLFAAFDIGRDENGQPVCDWGCILRSAGVHTILGVRRNAAWPKVTLGEKRGANNRFSEGERRPIPVPDYVITRLKQLVLLGGGHVQLNEERPAPLPRLVPNQRVRVVQGHYDGLEGLVDRDQKTRVWVLLDIMGKETRTLLPREALSLETSAAQ